MRCKHIDIIGYVDGLASENDVNHIEACAICSGKAKEYAKFINVATVVYKEGMKVKKKLEKDIQQIELARMKPLPAAIVVKVKRLKAYKTSSMMKKVKQMINQGKESADSFLGGINSTRMVLSAMPASPKDIAKTKKTKMKSKKNNSHKPAQK